MARGRPIVAAFVLALALAACGGGAGPTGAASGAALGTTSAPPATTQPNLTAFCAALSTIATSTDPTAIFAAYDAMEATAPPDIAGYVGPFVDAAREVSNASKQLPAGASQAQVDAMIQGLSPQGRALVLALGKTAKTGQLPDGAVGTVLHYGQQHCGL